MEILDKMRLSERLAETAKIMLGRKLTPEQMEEAEQIDESRGYIACSNEPLEIDELNELPSGEFVRFRQNFEHMTTPDASYGWKIPHTGYYPAKTITEVYDKEGLLKEKTVSRGNLYVWESSRTIQFDPPGRFIGKTKLRRSGF